MLPVLLLRSAILECFWCPKPLRCPAGQHDVEAHIFKPALIRRIGTGKEAMARTHPQHHWRYHELMISSHSSFQIHWGTGFPSSGREADHTGVGWTGEWLWNLTHTTLSTESDLFGDIFSHPMPPEKLLLPQFFGGGSKMLQILKSQWPAVGCHV